MVESTIIHGVTPEQLLEVVAHGVEKQFEAFKKEYKPNQPEKLLTRKETAEMLSISLVCLHDWTKKGILKHYKIGNRTYYKLSEIDDTLTKSNRK